MSLKQKSKSKRTWQDSPKMKIGEATARLKMKDQDNCRLDGKSPVPIIPSDQSAKFRF
jgi:hypothetical protein